MIQKTFSLIPKVRKFVIFNLLSKTKSTASTSAFTVRLRQLGLQRNTLLTVFIVAHGYNGSHIHFISQFTVKLPDQHRY